MSDEQVFVLGRGKLITPDGKEFQVSELTLRMTDRPVIRGIDGLPTWVGKPRDVTITFKESTDGKD